MAPRFWPLPALALWACCLVLSACGSTDIVRRSSLVPLLTAPAASAPRGAADVYVGDSVATTAALSAAAIDRGTQLFVPRTQLDGLLVFRPRAWVGLRFNWIYGFSAGAMRTADGTLPNPAPDVWGMGPGIDFAYGCGGRVWDCGGSADVLLASVPSQVESTVWTATGRTTLVEADSDTVFVGSLTARIGWRPREWLRLTAGLSLRNHPTNRAATSSIDDDADVDDGPIQVVLALGAELSPSRWIAFVSQIQWAVTRDPVRYGPIFGLGVRATVPRE